MTLWINTGPSVIGKACNMKMKSSNQMMEGSFHSDKHINTKFKKALVEPAAFSGIATTILRRQAAI